MILIESKIVAMKPIINQLYKLLNFSFKSSITKIKYPITSNIINNEHKNKIEVINLYVKINSPKDYIGLMTNSLRNSMEDICFNVVHQNEERPVPAHAVKTSTKY